MWRSFPAWAHVDQKGSTGLECIQGLVTFYDSYEQDGGLVVWSQSHTKVPEAVDPNSIFQMKKQKRDVGRSKAEEGPQYALRELRDRSKAFAHHC